MRLKLPRRDQIPHASFRKADRPSGETTCDRRLIELIDGRTVWIGREQWRIKYGLGSDLLMICGILMWSRVRGLSFAGDRVDESQAGAGIGELGRVEMFQQMGDCAVGPRVRHRMDMHSQYLLLEIRHQVGLGAKQIAQQAAGVVSPGQRLAHD